MFGIMALLVLMIPVVVWSPIGRALALRLQTEPPRDYLNALEQRVRQLEQFSLQQNQDLEHLQTRLAFYEQLAQQEKGPGLAEPKSSSPPRPLELNE